MQYQVLLEQAIAAREQTEQALRGSEERYRLAAEALHGLIYDWDLVTGEIQRSNGLFNLTGYHPHEIPTEVGWWAEQIIPEDYLKANQKFLDHVAAHLPAVDTEYRVRHKNGRYIWVWDSSRIIYDDQGVAVRLVGCTLNIDDRKQAEIRAALLQNLSIALSKSLTSEEVAQTIIDYAIQALGATAGSVVALRDEDQTLEIIGIVGYPEPVVQYWKRFPVTLPTAPLAVAVHTKTPLWFGSPRERLSVMSLTPDASMDSAYKAWASLPLLADDKAIGGLGLSFPTEQIFDQQEREFMVTLAYLCAQALQRAKLYEAEAQARQAAEQANRTKVRFMGMISHELRTPLTSIKGFASTLLADDIVWDAANQRYFIQIIDEETDKLQEMIEQLLDLSRMEAGTLSIEISPTTIQAILNLARTQLEIMTHNHHLVISVADDLPGIDGDENRIAQVLYNLVGNAVKYAPPQTAIMLRIYPVDGAVQHEIIDEGPGIAPEMREKVFEPFQQLTGAKKGAGLGLAICKGIVEAHGGRIWIEDHHPAGIKVIFTLPTLPL
jgi:PAS domain S-box-containing protein